MPEVTIKAPGIYDLTAAAWIARAGYVHGTLQLTRTGKDLTVVGTNNYQLLRVTIPGWACEGMEWPDGGSVRVDDVPNIENIYRVIKRADSVHLMVMEWQGCDVIEFEGTSYGIVRTSIRVKSNTRGPLDISKFADMPRDSAQGEVTLSDYAWGIVGRLARKVGDDEWKLIDHGPLRAVELVGNRGSQIVAMTIRPSD